MYIIKQIPEDFLVWEIPRIKKEKEGDYAYFWLRKRDYNTIDAVKMISEKLKLPMKNIGFAGTKDKMAITEQVISIRGINAERAKAICEKLSFKNIELSYISQGKKPVSLGDLKGNKFKITVRNLPEKLEIKNIDKIPNFFGPQRFSENNAEIGRAIVKKNFKKAFDMINQSYVKEYLEEHPGDFIGAIRQIPLRLRRMYVNAYQSFLWNKTAEAYLKTDYSEKKMIHLIGFATELKDNAVDEIEKDIMEEEGIILRDFIIPQMPELSSEGGERELFAAVENFDIKYETDELNKDKYKAAVSFLLPKGSYATAVIETLFFFYNC